MDGALEPYLSMRVYKVPSPFCFGSSTIFKIMCTWVCVWFCAREYRCPERSEEGAGSPRARVTCGNSSELPEVGVLGTEFGSFIRAVSAFRC